MLQQPRLFKIALINAKKPYLINVALINATTTASNLLSALIITPASLRQQTLPPQSCTASLT